MTAEADHGGDTLTIVSRGFISRMCVFVYCLPYLHVSATIYFMHVIQLLYIVSWHILFVLVQGVLNFYVYFYHGHFF